MDGDNSITASGTRIGYARVSTRDQELELQIAALRADGCDKVFEDHASGKLSSRPGLDEALAALSPGDVLTVWKLDRLGRSLRHLVETVTGLGDRGIGFRSLTESIDTTTGAGKFMFHVFAALAEFERDIIVERTRAGLAIAHANGRFGGRPHRLSPKQRELAVAMVRDGKTVAYVAQVLGVSRPTIYRAMEGSEG